MFLPPANGEFGAGGIPACIAGGIPVMLLQEVSWGGIPACLAGGIPACFAGLQGDIQAHTQGGS